jgi:hypothetical protein
VSASLSVSTAGTGGADGVAGGSSAGANAAGAAAGGGVAAAGGGGSNVVNGISVAVTPAISHLAPAATVQLSAVVTGTTDTAVAWAVQEGSAGGSVSAAGQYSAPTAPGTYHIIATSHANAQATGTATVIVSQIGDCSALPAAGVWENISPVISPPGTTNGDNWALAVVVDPYDPATVWAGMGNAGIFKSTNCGSTFTHVNTGSGGSNLDTGLPVSIQVDYLNRGVMYSSAFDGAQGLWKSTNSGVDWVQLFGPDSELDKVVVPPNVGSVAMDPKDPAHLVVSVHTACAAPYGFVCEAESTDAGATWKITTVQIPTDNWAPGAGAFILGPKSWLFGSYSNGLWLTQDSGSTWKNVTPAGASGATAGKTIILPFRQNPVDNLYYLPAEEGILQSTSSDGLTWSLIPNSGGRSVGLVFGSTNMYSSDQWSATYHTASLSAPTVWTTFAPPPAPALPADQGAPYLAYDSTHHILYSSNFQGGLWRTVAQ